MQNFRICFKGLCRTLRPVGWQVALSVVIGAVLVAASLMFVWISKRVVDCATGAVDYPFRTAVTIMAATMALQLVFRVAQRYWEGFTVIRAQNRLRANVYERVLRSTWNGKDRFHSGDTVNRLEEDISVVVDFLCVTLPECVVTLLQFIASCLFLFKLSPQLAWILVFIMPVAVLGSRLFFRKMRLLTNRIRAADSRVQGHMQETLQHRILVKTLGATVPVLEKMNILQRDVYDKTLTRLNYGAISRAFINAGFATGYALAFFWGANGLREGTVTYGLMVAFLQLVGQIQRPIADITRYIPSFIRSLSSEDRLLELENLPQEHAGADVLVPGAPGIRVSGLRYTYPGSASPVLNGISFDFRPGTMTAVTGPTGVGKSSLLRVILALLVPDSGSVTIYSDGVECPVGVDTRVNFMYVPQGNSLLSGSIRENLRLAKPSATEEEMNEVLRLAAAEFVSELPAGLDTEVAEIGNGLSEGQGQRIAIARALLHPGGVLILDEATSALDSETESRLLENIFRRYRGSKTIICVTHRPAATKYADAEFNLS